ncbi:MAG: tyrosine-type recombinase/integrase [Deltaproteobacteria bacterium]|nr:tyrosine-type recombinase/integrase [Deltaproteobacteria bacterium]
MNFFKRGKRYYLQWWEGDRRRYKSLGPAVKTETQAKIIVAELEKAGLEEKLARLDPSRLTLGRFIPQYLSERKGHIKPKSLARYDVSLRMLQADLGKNFLLRSLTTRKLQQWAGLRLQQGVSRAGVNTDLRHIRGALNWAFDMGMLQKAPKIKLLKEPQNLPRHLTAEQAQSLLKAEANADRRRLWGFLLWTGMRRAEVLGMRWNHIVWDPKPAALVTGKGDKQRMVPLLPAAVAFLAGLDQDQVDGPICVWPRTEVGQVWVMPTHPSGIAEPVMVVPKPDTVTRWFKVAARAAGLDCRLHDLRHTAITWMVSRGVMLRVAQEIAGHAHYSTTERYAKALVADLYDAASKGL